MLVTEALRVEGFSSRLFTSPSATNETHISNASLAPEVVDN